MNQLILTAIIEEKLKDKPNFILIRQLQQMLDNPKSRATSQ